MGPSTNDENAESDAYHVETFVERHTTHTIVVFETQNKYNLWYDIINCIMYCWIFVIVFLCLQHCRAILATELNMNSEIYAFIDTAFVECLSICWILLGFSDSLLHTYSSVANIRTNLFIVLYIDLQLSTILTLTVRPISIMMDSSVNITATNFGWTLCNSIFSCYYDIPEIVFSNWNISSHITCTYIQILSFNFILGKYVKEIKSLFILTLSIAGRFGLNTILLRSTKFTSPFTVLFYYDYCIGYQFFVNREKIFHLFRLRKCNTYVYSSLIFVVFVICVNMGATLSRPVWLEYIATCQFYYSFTSCTYYILPELSSGCIAGCMILLSSITHSCRPDSEPTDTFAQRVEYEVSSYDVSIARLLDLFSAVVFCTPLSVFCAIIFKLMLDDDAGTFLYICTFMLVPAFIIAVMRLSAKYRSLIVTEILNCVVKTCRKIGFSDRLGFVAVLQEANKPGAMQDACDLESVHSDMTT